jgi:chromosome segregation ATPase
VHTEKKQRRTVAFGGKDTTIEPDASAADSEQHRKDQMALIHAIYEKPDDFKPEVHMEFPGTNEVVRGGICGEHLSSRVDNLVWLYEQYTQKETENIQLGEEIAELKHQIKEASDKAGREETERTGLETARLGKLTDQLKASEVVSAALTTQLETAAAELKKFQDAAALPKPDVNLLVQQLAASKAQVESLSVKLEAAKKAPAAAPAPAAAADPASIRKTVMAIAIKQIQANTAQWEAKLTTTQSQLTSIQSQLDAEKLAHAETKKSMEDASRSALKKMEDRHVGNVLGIVKDVTTEASDNERKLFEAFGMLQTEFIAYKAKTQESERKMLSIADYMKLPKPSSSSSSSSSSL